MKRRAAFRLDLLGHGGLVQIIGRGALHRRVLEAPDPIELRHAQPVEQLLEVRSGFAREIRR